MFPRDFLTLLQIGLLSMMFLLILNVLLNDGKIRFAYRVSSITRLPGKLALSEAFLVNPMCAWSFGSNSGRMSESRNFVPNIA